MLQEQMKQTPWSELVLLKTNSYAVLSQFVQCLGLWINKFQNKINSVGEGCCWQSWKMLCKHCCLPRAPGNPAAELPVATVIIAEADDVTARGQMKELDVINVSIIYAKVSPLKVCSYRRSNSLSIHFGLQIIGMLKAPLLFTQIELQMHCFFNILYFSATNCLETRYFLIRVNRFCCAICKNQKKTKRHELFAIFYSTWLQTRQRLFTKNEIWDLNCKCITSLL